ncbi:hypothetical protein BDZ89DRAFT_1014835 [Hymenopellis radicata]|nr:hypothetical protein BDZ89DRAFT_1014835 [Hymenopellis radicata]
MTSPPASPIETARPKKGFRTSCLNCRRRKIKCDGQRPICTACRTSPSHADCEYDSHGGLTRSQSLEEQITLLESRIHQLENPGIPNDVVSLTQPYPPQIQADAGGLTPAQDSRLPSHLIDLKDWELSEILRNSSLIQTALQSSNDIGFFLNPSRFTNAVAARDPVERPLNALMSAVFLWGSHLSDNSDINRHEPILLVRTIREVSQGLASGHPQAVLHCIQAEVLLSHYFYRQSRYLEGKYHSSAAVSLVLSAQLHKIRSVDPPSELAFIKTSLPPAKDAVEEGERINGFWTVFILSNCWSTVDGSPSPFPWPCSSEARVDLPWPLDIGSYAQSSRPHEFRTSYTVQKFLDDQHDSGTSALALQAKASILFDHASRVVSSYQPGMSQRLASQFFASFNAFQTTIEKFTSTLPSLTSSATAQAVVTHGLAHAAMIRLHAPFLSQNPASRACIAVSMRAIVRSINTVDIPCLPIVDSIIGIIWARSCQVLVTEMASMGSAPSSTRNEPVQIFSSIFAVMDRMKARYPVLNDQLVRMRATQSSLNVLASATLSQ